MGEADRDTVRTLGLFVPASKKKSIDLKTL